MPSTSIQAGQRLGYEVAVEGDERGEGLLSELAQPIGHRAAGGQPGQAAEARHQGIAAEIAQVFQAPGTDIEQREQHQGDPGTAVVGAEPGERLAQSCPQIDLAQIAPKQFQTAERGETNWIVSSRLTTRRRLATLKRIRGASSVKGWNVGPFSLKSALGVPLIHFDRLKMPRLFSDWG